MSPVEQASSAVSPKGVMKRSQRAFLAAAREEVLEPVNAIIAFSDILLAETGESREEAFAADLRKIHESGRRLREMVGEFLGPDAFAGQEGEAAFAALKSRVRHDMLNALNAVINYCEMWLEDAEEHFLQGYGPDLERIHGHGKHCLAVLDRVLAYRPKEAPDDDGGAGETHVPGVDPLFAWEQHVDKAAAAEPGFCLVVDDNATNRDILCRLLLRQGHKVATAVNGREALDMVRAEEYVLKQRREQ